MGKLKPENGWTSKECIKKSLNDIDKLLVKYRYKVYSDKCNIVYTGGNKTRFKCIDQIGNVGIVEVKK